MKTAFDFAQRELNSPRTHQLPIYWLIKPCLLQLGIIEPNDAVAFLLNQRGAQIISIELGIGKTCRTVTNPIVIFGPQIAYCPTKNVRFKVFQHSREFVVACARPSFRARVDKSAQIKDTQKLRKAGDRCVWDWLKSA